MSFQPAFNARLIAEVKKYPCLYNHSKRGSGDTMERMKIWDSIALTTWKVTVFSSLRSWTVFLHPLTVNRAHLQLVSYLSLFYVTDHLTRVLQILQIKSGNGGLGSFIDKRIKELFISLNGFYRHILTI
uniref:MADF domain-containing protein n=1 Tax=Heterorhabditis bacteriophora TaxID=37862 RepID=A0A1I7WBL6_HETBA